MGKILISAPVRQDEEIFDLYLDSLRNLYVPNGYTIDKMFVFHSPSLLFHQVPVRGFPPDALSSASGGFIPVNQRVQGS